MPQSHGTPDTDTPLGLGQEQGQSNNCWLEDDSTATLGNSQGRLTTRRVDELRPHPNYARLGLRVPASKLNALIEQGADAFLGRLEITSQGIIIDGYARWEVARLLKRPTVQCLEHNISESEALYRLLLAHRPSPGLVPFNRIILALELEDHFRQKARLHQQAGGKDKGSSKLSEAERIDVRNKVAAAAGVSVGTLNHVKQLLAKVAPAILQALRDGLIKIHRAWTWSKLPREDQRERLEFHKRRRGMDRTAKRLVAAQVKKRGFSQSPKPVFRIASSVETVGRLASLAPDLLRSIEIVVVKTPGRILAISNDVARELGIGEEVPCRTKIQ
jgi:hypothetical protein